MSTVGATEPLSAQMVAWCVLHCVLVEGDLRSVWAALDEPLRVALTRRWVLDNVDAPELAGSDLNDLSVALAEIRSEHPLWPTFEAWVVADMQAGWSHVDLDRWCWETDPRPVSVDHEHVIFADPSTEREIDGKRVMDAFTWTMRHDAEGWWVAGLGEQPASPGWTTLRE